MAKAKSPVPQGLHTVTPHLILDDAATAIDWYKRGFGADEISRSAGPDGKIMHAEIRIGNSHLYLNDAMGGGKGPSSLLPSTEKPVSAVSPCSETMCPLNWLSP